VFSTFTATNPSIYLDIDRAKAQALGLNMSDVFTALQATLGGIYVNNFNLFGRTWQVNVQGEAPIAATFPTSGRSMCATAPARWCRSARSPPEDRDRAAGHHPLQQLPLGHGQRRSGGRRLVGNRDRRDGGAFQITLPPATPTNGPAPPIRSRQASGQTGIILALAMLFAYLFLVALYESWTIPIPVLLSVTVGVLGSYLGDQDRRAEPRSLRPDRPRGADRAGRQERHPDRRIRQGAARGRAVDRGRRGAGRRCGSAP
jgi:hypothetical protein